MTIKAHSIFNSDLIFPVYAKYPQQVNAQPAFITLDTRDGEIDADYSGEIGNGLPADVWNGIVIRFPINCMSTTSEIDTMIADCLADFQAVLDCEDGEELESLKYDIERKLAAGSETSICTLAEYLAYESEYPDENQSIEAFAADLLDGNGDNNVWFSPELDSADHVIDALLDMWADTLYAGDDLPALAAQALLADGRCADSQWMDELREFAGQDK